MRHLPEGMKGVEIGCGNLSSDRICSISVRCTIASVWGSREFRKEHGSVIGTAATLASDQLLIPVACNFAVWTVHWPIASTASPRTSNLRRSSPPANLWLGTKRAASRYLRIRSFFDATSARRKWRKRRHFSRSGRRGSRSTTP